MIEKIQAIIMQFKESKLKLELSIMEKFDSEGGKIVYMILQFTLDVLSTIAWYLLFNNLVNKI